MLRKFVYLAAVLLVSGLLCSPGAVADIMNFEYTLPGGDSYWAISFEGTDTYLGWCVDQDETLATSGSTYVEVWSTLDPTIPYSPTKFYAGTDPDTQYNWNMVNYIINHNDEVSAGSTQNAIWMMVDGLIWPTGDTAANTLVTNAVNFGSSYVPGPGEVTAWLAYDPTSGVEKQAVIFEVKNPVPEASTLMLFGSGLSGLMFFARKKGLIKF